MFEIPYITVHRNAKSHQVSFEEILQHEFDEKDTGFEPQGSATMTRFVEQVDERVLRKTHVNHMVRQLQEFNNAHGELFEVPRDSLYHTFHIPKHSGGLRRIDEPLPELMDALRELKLLLENMGALYHTNAYAYIPGRSTIDAIKKHQSAGSKWFLKTDFKNFFGSTTERFLFDSVSTVFPFSEIVKREDGSEALKRALSLCFYNEGLPQGTPISPMLTNLMMIPADFKITRLLVPEGFVYTRYADDIQISSKYDFDWKAKCKLIDSVLEELHAPFKIKNEKTRYGSSAGRNWNLGVMLNKDGDITVGRKRKEQLKAMLYNYLRDRDKGIRWDLHDVQVLAGNISYHNMVEPEYTKGFIKWFNDKHKVNIMRMIREDLRREQG